MLVSRTTRARRANFRDDQIEHFLLIVAGIAILDVADGEVEQAAAQGGR